MKKLSKTLNKEIIKRFNLTCKEIVNRNIRTKTKKNKKNKQICDIIRTTIPKSVYDMQVKLDAKSITNRAMTFNLNYELLTKLDPCYDHKRSNQTGLQDSDQLVTDRTTSQLGGSVIDARIGYHEEIECENGQIFELSDYHMKTLLDGRTKKEVVWATTEKEMYMARAFSYMVKNYKYFTIKSLVDAACTCKWETEAIEFLRMFDPKKGVQFCKGKYNFQKADVKRHYRHKKIVAMIFRHLLNDKSIPAVNRRRGWAVLMAAPITSIAGSIRHYLMGNDAEVCDSKAKPFWDSMADWYVSPLDATSYNHEEEIDEDDTPSITFDNMIHFAELYFKLKETPTQTKEIIEDTEEDDSESIMNEMTNTYREEIVRSFKYSETNEEN